MFLKPAVLLIISCTMVVGNNFVAMHDRVAEVALNIAPTDVFTTPQAAQLAEAVGRGDEKKIRWLVDQGVDVNSVGLRGMTALYWALGKRNIIGFRRLLDHGADANTVTCCDEQAEGVVHKLSVMGLAARVDDPSYLQALLDHGGDPNRVINEANDTPIFQAIGERRTENIKLLVKYHADLNYHGGSGNTPLLVAVNAKQFEIALLLLRAGANPRVQDRWGYSTITTLKKFGNRGIVQPKDNDAYLELISELKKYDLAPWGNGKFPVYRQGESNPEWQ